MSGDNTWIPCQSVEGEDDWALFFDDYLQDQQVPPEKVAPSKENHQISDSTILFGAEQYSPDSIIAVVKQLIAKEQKNKNLPKTEDYQKGPTEFRPVAMKERIITTGSLSNTSNFDKIKIPATYKDEKREQFTEKIEVEDISRDLDNPPAPRRMRTRAQAQADSESTTIRTRSTSPDSNNISYVHPYFLAPQSSRLDRNLGLPPNEATETRRVLQLYIQKQEEVCRGVQRIYDGLLKADRCRKLIMKWAKADAHVGVNRDMSDGEDWYDNEEWELDEDLKKGQDEDEEDAATTAKKTRTRRQ